MPFLKAAGLNESVDEAALSLVQRFVEGVRDNLHDHQQFRQHPVPRTRVTSLEPTTDPALLNEFTQSVCVLRFGQNKSE